MSETVQNLQKLNAKLRALAAKYGGGKPVATVGYTAAYALAVHENREMAWKGLSRDPRKRRIELGGDPAEARPRARKREPKGRFWDPQGRAKAKFLEDPARALQKQLANMIAADLARGVEMGPALLKAALFLQRESQKEVPVDSGNLRASAFTRLTTEPFDAAQEIGRPGS